MTQTFLSICLLVMMAATTYPIAGQSLSPDLDQVTKNIEGYFRQKRPDWKYETVPPGPLGTPPSPKVVVYFWSSEKCVTAEVFIDDESTGRQPVACRVKLAITESESPLIVQNNLSRFVMTERSATPVQVGDKGYLWHGTELVFIKDKFTFWLGGLDLRIGNSANNDVFLKKLAKEIADAVSVN